MELSNIKMSFLLPNSTAVTQPLDAGIIYSFKRRYTKLFMEHALRNFENGAENIYKIFLLQAIGYCGKAWKDVPEECVQNCFRSTRLVATGTKSAQVQREINMAVNKTIETEINEMIIDVTLAH